MAGEEGGGGARLGQIPGNLDQVNSLLGDITTKLGNLRSQMPFIQVDPKPFDDIANHMERIARLNKKWAEALGERAKLEKDLVERLKKIVKATDRLKEDQTKLLKMQKTKKGLNKDEEKQLVAIGRELADNEEEVKGIVESQGKLESKWKIVGKLIAQDVLGALDKVAKSMISLTIDFLIVGFQKVYDLVERTTRATGQFRMALGATTAGMSNLEKEGWKLEGAMRGLSNAELGIGLKELGEATRAFGFADEKLSDFRVTAVQAGRAFGIGSQAAGGLARTMKQLGFEGKESAGVFMDISDAANAAGVPVGDFASEVRQSSNFMAQFGRQGKKTFLDTAAYAKRLGLSLKTLEGFTDATDTFEGAANAASKMNAVFGTSINGLELMLENDPSKRLEMVRKALVGQGRTFESMNRQEKKFLAQTLSISEEELAGVIQNNETLETFQKRKAAAARKEIDDQKALQRAMSRTAETINNWGATFDSVTREIKGIFDDLLGKDFFQRLPGKIKEATAAVREFIGEFRKSKEGKELIESVRTAAMGLWSVMKKLAPVALKVFKFIVDHHKVILGVWAGFKMFAVGGAILTGINSFLALMGTGATVGGALLGFGKVLMTLVGTIGKVLFGPVGLVLMAGAAGVAIGRFIGSLEIGGKKIDDWVVLGYEKIGEFFKMLWKAFKESKLGKFLNLNDSADDLRKKGTLSGMTDQSLETLVGNFGKAQAGQLGGKQLKVLQEIAMVNEDLVEYLAKRQGLEVQAVRDVLSRAKPATVVAPPPTPVQVKTADVTASPAQNFAGQAKSTKAGAKKETTVNVNLHLDSKQVSRQVVRTMGSE